MNLIKNILLYGLLLISISSFSQFSINTELKYLQIVNNQNDDDLILDNIANAEFFVDSLILSQHYSFTESQFLYELSKSYYLTRKFDFSLFSLLRQRCLFPNKTIQKQSENLFREALFSNNLSDSLNQIIFEKTKFKNIPKNLNDRFNLLLQMSSIINTKNISYSIYKIGLIYRSFEPNIPIWYQHWEYLSIINLKPKNIKQVMPDAQTAAPIYKQIQSKRLQYKVYRKSIKHYRKHKAYKTASDLLAEYKNHKTNLFLKVDILYKSIHLKILRAI